MEALKAREPESGLLVTIQCTTEWGVFPLLRVVVSLPLLFFVTTECSLFSEVTP
jgi:hypothetical protein